MRSVKHVVLAAVASVALAPALWASPASAETTLTVGKAAANSDAIIPVNVGDQVGIFKKHGLKLKIVDFSGGSKMAQALAAGSIDIGDGAGTEMVLTYKGVPAKAICESAGPLSFLAIGVPKDSPIKSIDDLKGKKIGISRAGSLTDHIAHDLAKQKGWGEDGITTVAIGNGSAGIVAAFRQHLIDADISVTSLFLTMEEKGTGRLLAPVSKFMGANASGTLFASDKLMKENPEAVRAFVAGWIDTIAWMRSHKAETVKIESKLVGFPESVMAKEYDITIGMFTDDCRFDQESLKNLKETFVKLKEMPASADMSKLYTEEFLPKKKM